MTYTTTEEEKKRLNGGANNPSAAATQQSGTVQNPQRSGTAYDPQTNQNYVTAMNALKTVEQNAPKYAGSYDSGVMEAFNRIANRGKFSYDVSTDPLYEQLRQEYAQQGKLAMQDTMGQAAALTGGYGSSYAQSVGQQQYDAYLQRLNEVVPELEANAFARYQAEGDELKDQYSMLSDMRDREYAQYEDAYDRWFNERSYAQNAAENEYDRGRQEWADQQALEAQAYERAWQENQRDYERGLRAEETEYARQQALDEQQYERMGDSRGYVTALIGNGYNPSDEELAGAGMTRPQANQLLYNYYTTNGMNVPSWLNEALGIEAQSGGGTGGGRNNVEILQQLINDEMQQAGKSKEENWQNARNYIANAYKAGDITREEYVKLVNKNTVNKNQYTSTGGIL